MNRLVIHHIDESDPPQFLISRADHKTASPVEVTSPFDFPVEGIPDSNLMRELHWYLEGRVAHLSGGFLLNICWGTRSVPSFERSEVYAKDWSERSRER